MVLVTPTSRRNHADRAAPQ